MCERRKITVLKGAASVILRRREDETRAERRKEELKKIKDLLLNLAQRVDELERGEAA